MATVLEEIRTLVERLPPDHQRRVLEFVQDLTQTHPATASLPTTRLPPGTPGTDLLRFLQHFKPSPEDLEAMERALEDCERIEPDEY